MNGIIHSVWLAPSLVVVFVRVVSDVCDGLHLFTRLGWCLFHSPSPPISLGTKAFINCWFYMPLNWFLRMIWRLSWESGERPVKLPRSKVRLERGHWHVPLGFVLRVIRAGTEFENVSARGQRENTRCISYEPGPPAAEETELQKGPGIPSGLHPRAVLCRGRCRLGLACPQAVYSHLPTHTACLKV